MIDDTTRMSAGASLRTTRGTNVEPPSEESSRSRYMPGGQDPSTVTSNVGDHRHSMSPVCGSIAGSASCSTGNGPPRHTSRPPLPAVPPHAERPGPHRVALGAGHDRHPLARQDAVGGGVGLDLVLDLVLEGERVVARARPLVLGPDGEGAGRRRGRTGRHRPRPGRRGRAHQPRRGPGRHRIRRREQAAEHGPPPPVHRRARSGRVRGRSRSRPVPLVVPPLVAHPEMLGPRHPAHA